MTPLGVVRPALGLSVTLGTEVAQCGSCEATVRTKKTHARETQVAHRVEHFGDINERW